MKTSGWSTVHTTAAQLLLRSPSECRRHLPPMRTKALKIITDKVDASEAGVSEPDQ